MEKDINIGEAELEIMKVLWRANAPVNTQFINKAVEAKGWKRTTVSTFLTRLTVKGVIKGEKEGNTYYYTALISEREYRRARTKNLISTLYGGSMKEFAASLFEDGALDENDIGELRAYINSEDR